MRDRARMNNDILSPGYQGGQILSRQPVSHPPRIYRNERGYVLVAESDGGKLKRGLHLNGVKRGDIEGLSAQSRRRLVRALYTFKYTKGDVFNVTFTFPGSPVLNDDQCKAVFIRWCADVVQRGWSAIWRQQKQDRNILHFHLVLCVPFFTDFGADDFISTDMNSKHLVRDRNRYYRSRFPVAVDIEDSWMKACDTMGPKLIKVPCKNRLGAAALLSQHPSFRDGYGVDIGNLYAPRDVKFYEYISCHAGRNEQVAKWCGRQWGIIGRQGFDRLGNELISQSVEQYQRVTKRISELTYQKRKERLDGYWNKKLEEVVRGMTPEQQSALAVSGGEIMMSDDEELRRKQQYEHLEEGIGYQGITYVWTNPDVRRIFSEEGFDVKVPSNN